MGLTCRSGKWQAEMGQGQGGRLSLEPPQLAEATRTADAGTLYRRFLGSPPHLTPILLARLCTVDYQRRLALVAADAATGQGVAIARYE